MSAAQADAPERGTMMNNSRHSLCIAAALSALVAGCGTGQPAAPAGTADEPAAAPAAPVASAGQQWRFAATNDGAMLTLGGDASPAMRLGCMAEAREMLINVPSFRPVGSEERMTFGAGGTAETFVADPGGDRARGGVSATGPVPDNLEQLLSGGMSANYGSQNSGPHPPLTAAMLRKFVEACGSGRPPEPGKDEPEPASGNVSACLIQDGKRLPAMRLRGIGTEPFWAAQIEGRCVTYSHPEDQSGTRVWTNFSGSAERGTWAGALNGQPFTLKTRPQPGCSDGMSDNRYPIAVALTVNGEQRQGCAEPK